MDTTTRTKANSRKASERSPPENPPQLKRSPTKKSIKITNFFTPPSKDPRIDITNSTSIEEIGNSHLSSSPSSSSSSSKPFSSVSNQSKDDSDTPMEEETSKKNSSRDYLLSSLHLDEYEDSGGGNIECIPLIMALDNLVRCFIDRSFVAKMKSSTNTSRAVL